MKRLEIVLIGHSLTLSELNAELLDHGHGVRHLSDQQALDALTMPDGGVLIEDGSLDLSQEHLSAFGHCTHLRLRVGFGN
ncbi:hypothetical protein C5I_0107445, partial [Pseudomonas syringae pv. syringae FF5]